MNQGDRRVLHSLWGFGMAAGLAVPFAFFLGWPPATALLLGYASHLVADSATKSGIRMLYPNPARFHLLPKGWRITTGSLAEEMMAALLLAPMLFLLFSHPLS